MDKIFLQHCSFDVLIGINEEERSEKQELVIDLELFLDTKEAAISEDLQKTANYLEAHRLIKQYLESKEHILVESVAEEIATLMLDNFSIGSVKIKINKPKPAVERNSTYFGVEIERSRLK